MSDLTDSLIAHWKMNDVAGQTTVLDNTENNNDGTSAANIVSTTGKINEAIVFDGTNDYVDTGDTFQSTFRDSFLISMWIKVTDGQVEGGQHLFSVTQDANNHLYCYIHANGSLGLFYKAGGNEAQLLTKSVLFLDGENPWRNVSFVADSTTAGVGGLKIYFDGVLQEANAVSVGDTTDVVFSNYTVSTYDMNIGRLNALSPSSYFGGSLDDVRIYNKALSQSEVSAIYNDGNGTEILSEMECSRRQLRKRRC